MRRLRCECGHGIELTDEQENELAGKFFACSECGLTRRIRPLDLPTLSVDTETGLPGNDFLPLLELDLPTLSPDLEAPSRLPGESEKTKQRTRAPIRRPRTASRRFLSATDFRYPGEHQSLILALALLFVLIVVTTAATVGIMLAIVGISIALFKIEESQLLGKCSEVGGRDCDGIYNLARIAGSTLYGPANGLHPR